MEGGGPEAAVKVGEVVEGEEAGDVEGVGVGVEDLEEGEVGWRRGGWMGGGGTTGCAEGAGKEAGEAEGEGRLWGEGSAGGGEGETGGGKGGGGGEAIGQVGYGGGPGGGEEAKKG
ncbi:hypothetical protein CYMTET_15650 [Cymbomonas tetramitiformis]|uniref:Uncharacterized protein n=1 Tax=Cymbomonas tetramitiformis TaxID=36881 RepID=A0AAE0GDX8_9CHLO|nr:hypothetical protein CYMTET_15650 [Cymbomonas tetramitiformis]